jgi:serine/threonine protein phosphatase 1
MKRVLVIGDIHGNHKGMMQALERSKFNNEKDILISLGDVVDGHSQSFEVVEELLKIKNLIAIKGNHDDWFNQWIETGINPSNWRQGQAQTGLSYIINLLNGEITEADSLTIQHILKPKDIPETHKNFFKNQVNYHLDNDNNLFVHGGFNRYYSLEEQTESDFYWDRDLWNQAINFQNMQNRSIDKTNKFNTIGDYKEIYIGHTQTQFWNIDIPMNAANIWNLDTGAGMFGYVSIMDIKTKEFWQSDEAIKLYPKYKGRS